MRKMSCRASEKHVQVLGKRGIPRTGYGSDNEEKKKGKD